MKNQHICGEYGTVEVSWEAGNPEIVLAAVAEGDPFNTDTPSVRMSVQAADLADDLAAIQGEGDTPPATGEDFPVIRRAGLGSLGGPTGVGYAMTLLNEYGCATLLWIGRPTSAEPGLPTKGVRVLLSEQNLGALEDLVATIADAADAAARIRADITGIPVTA